MPVKLDTTRLTRLRRAARPAIDTGVASAAGMIAELEQQLAPVDTGDLASTPRVEGAVGSMKRQVIAGGKAGEVTGEEVDYPNYVEADQPFAEPAKNAIDVLEEVAREVRKLL